MSALSCFTCRFDCSKKGAQRNCLVQLCFTEEAVESLEHIAGAIIAAKEESAKLYVNDVKRAQEEMVRAAEQPSTSTSNKIKKRSWLVRIGNLSYRVCVRSMEFFHGFASGALDAAAAFVRGGNTSGGAISAHVPSRG